MRMASLRPRDENAIEASVTIQCALEEIFTFYRDFKNLPSFLGDVVAVERIGPLGTQTRDDKIRGADEMAIAS
jgi:hypothetical protein